MEVCYHPVQCKLVLRGEALPASEVSENSTVGFMMKSLNGDINVGQRMSTL